MRKLIFSIALWAILYFSVLVYANNAWAFSTSHGLSGFSALERCDRHKGEDWVKCQERVQSEGPPVVPIPAAAWLFLSALGLLFWRKK